MHLLLQALFACLGLIGTNGQEKVEEFPTKAGQALEAIAQAKRRKGYWDL